MVILLTKRGVMTISLKKRLTFEELVQENRRQILNDAVLMEKIEENIERRKYQSLYNKKQEKI